MFPPGLYTLADDTVRSEVTVLSQAEALLIGGAEVLQLRLKRTPPALAVAICRAAVAQAHAQHAILLVNDRVDWALLSSADGVHLGEEDLPLSEARALLGPAAIVGVTVRSTAQAEAAFALGATYVGLGPVFPPRSKAVDAPLLGLEGLRQVAQQSPLPVVAIGGIGLSNMASVARAGAYGAAVVSDLLLAQDVPARVRLLQEEFLRGARERV
jgi:thiamine-phosphate pyrophosphorylase